MEFNNFLFEVKDGIAYFSVNRPEVLNALNKESWEEIDKFADLLNTDDSIKLAIITGTGEKSFVSGADINFLKARTSITALGGLAQNALQKLENSPKPVIAAVNGYAFGGGCELALACDIRIASENARFALPELSLGILPGAGGTQRLAKLIGQGRAKEMILTSRRITAEEALSYGLVTKVVPLSGLIAEAESTAKTILSKGPVAVNLAKKCVNAALSTDATAGSLLELLSFSVLISSEDRMEGVNSFLEKRTPRFQGK
ncbi:MAG: enoyl-CoA hydratase/isomerase family protein [Lachnospiraceae bacterium]|jgi:enoyl-CoA hydratase|nr:enoyl-CoA hydratase/isomerase family protein [Lachnospiraceae bacterium]